MCRKQPGIAIGRLCEKCTWSVAVLLAAALRCVLITMTNDDLPHSTYSFFFGACCWFNMKLIFNNNSYNHIPHAFTTSLLSDRTTHCLHANATNSIRQQQHGFLPDSSAVFFFLWVRFAISKQATEFAFRVPPLLIRRCWCIFATSATTGVWPADVSFAATLV